MKIQKSNLIRIDPERFLEEFLVRMDQKIQEKNKKEISKNFKNIYCKPK